MEILRWKGTTMSMTFHSDYAIYGFDKIEIENFLESHGINAPLNPPDLVLKSKNVPSWMLDLRAKEIFTVWHAASILIGVNPYSQEFQDLEYDQRFNLAKDLLEEAIAVGKLTAFKKDGQDNFYHNDLRTWANSINREWCIPPMTDSRSQVQTSAIPQNNNVVLERLEQVERDNAGLQADKVKLTAKLEKAQETINQQKLQLTDATDRLSISIREHATFQTEFDSLKADALEGKTKSTLLKIVGGIAMSGCGMDIHANRLDGISQTVDDLALMGVTIKEDTLRKHLKAAAELIPKPK